MGTCSNPHMCLGLHGLPRSHLPLYPSLFDYVVCVGITYTTRRPSESTPLDRRSGLTSITVQRLTGDCKELAKAAAASPSA